MKNYLLIHAIIFLIFAATPAESLPRFAAEMNLKCQNCHIDPNGGGMRTYYGAVLFGNGTLPLLGKEDTTFILPLYTTALSDIVSFGTDVRTYFMYQPQGRISTFYQMQGSIYLNVRLANKFFVYVNKGLYSGFEVFGMASILPAGGYVKVGRFTPAFGLRTDDHTNYVRSKTDFVNGRREDTGFEIGISPSFLTLSFGVFNGIKGNDFSDGRLRLISATGTGKFKIGDFKFSAGASAWLNNLKGGRLTMFGGFGQVCYSALTLGGEVDLKQDKGATGKHEFISLLEADFLVVRGVDLKFMYDYYDPDTGLKTGIQERYSFGVEFFPVTGVEVRPIYRINRDSAGGPKSEQLEVHFHFYM